MTNKGNNRVLVVTDMNVSEEEAYTKPMFEKLIEYAIESEALGTEAQKEKKKKKR